MKMIWTLGSAMLTLAVVTAGAQAQSATTTASDKNSITVTGCLQSADPTAVGTSGTASTPAGANRSGAASGPFMLVNARVGNAPGGGSGVTSVAPAGSGTTDSAVRAGSTRPSPAISGAVDKNGEPADASKTFSLTGFPELPQHVGQEVEISGNMVASAGASGSNAASANSTTAGSRAGATQQIEVKSIRMIASVCAAK